MELPILYSKGLQIKMSTKRVIAEPEVWFYLIVSVPDLCTLTYFKQYSDVFILSGSSLFAKVGCIDIQNQRG